MKPTRIPPLASCVLGIAGAVAAQTAEVFPVAELAGPDQAALEDRFLPAQSCEEIKHGQKCICDDGAVEAVFIDGLSDWFTITPVGVPLGGRSPAYLGLPAGTAPTFSSGAVTRWNGIDGILSVSAFPGGSEVSCFSVKARTP